MKWIVATILMAVLAMILNLSLLVYAIYALLAILLISRWLTRQWTASVEAERVCPIRSVRIGAEVAVAIKLKHTGR